MKLEFDFMKVIQFTNPVQGSAFERLKRSLLTLMIRQKDKLFRDSVDPSGTPWKQLSPLVAEARNKKNTRSKAQIKELKKKNSKFAEHKILIDTGALATSLASQTAGGNTIHLITASDITLGTNLPYAAIQNFGGKIQRNGHTITIPPRPFIGFGEADNSQIKEKIAAVVAKETKVAAK